MNWSDYASPILRHIHLRTSFGASWLIKLSPPAFFWLLNNFQAEVSGLSSKTATRMKSWEPVIFPTQSDISSIHLTHRPTKNEKEETNSNDIRYQRNPSRDALPRRRLQRSHI